MGWKDAPEVSEKWQTAPEVGGAPADNGVDPVPVDQPGWDWLRNKMPGTFNTVREGVAGFAEGVGDLPNIVPNVINAGQGLYDLHFGSGTGEVAPENTWKPWMDDKEGVFFSSPGDKTIAELNPPIAGYESVRRAGQISGSAAPFGLGAMIAAPVLATSGRLIGGVADTLLDEENDKWARTGEALLPLATGGVKTVRGAATRAGVPIPKKINATTLPAVSAAVGSISPETAAVIGSTIKGADLATRGSKGIKPDLAATLARTLAPLAVDDPRWAR